MPSAVLDDLKGLFNRAWWPMFRRGRLALTAGGYSFARLLAPVAACGMLTAWSALFSGFGNIMHAFQLKPVMNHWWVLLLSGLVGVGFGIAALVYYPGLSLSFAVVLVAWWLMVTGILGIYGAVLEKRLGVHWGWTAAFGVLSVVASVFALLSPPVTLAAIMGLIAAFAIVTGVALLMGAFKLRSLVRP